MTKLNTRAELSAAIAEKVMGYYAAQTTNCSGVPSQMWIKDALDQREQKDWNPAEDLNHAFKALEKRVDEFTTWTDILLLIAMDMDTKGYDFALAACLFLLDYEGVEYELGGELAKLERLKAELEEQNHE